MIYIHGAIVVRLEAKPRDAVAVGPVAVYRLTATEMSLPLS
jgi:hypothetical protein